MARRALDWLACFLLVAVSWIVYRKMLRLWWMFENPGVTRKSVSLYYYTAGRPQEERSAPHDTLFIT
jgi:hypothetical protein